jgi:macrolide transport system ATP-binding/permease protein
MFWRRSRKQEDFSEEIRSHLALETDRLISEGISPEKVGQDARKRFGSVATAEERFYEAGRILWLDRLRQDSRYALRTMRRNPTFTLTAVLTLAIGIGANTAVFALVDCTFLRPLQYKNPVQLVAIWNRGTHGNSFDKRTDSYPDFEEFKKHAHSFDELAAATWAGFSGRVLIGQGPAREVMADPVSESFFRLLGVSTVLGRTFTPEDTRAGCSIVLGYKFWIDVLQSESGIADRSLMLDNQSCRVLGVMPAGFEFYPRQTDLWILITPDSIPQIGIGVFGRLKRGVTPQQALSEVVAIHHPYYAVPRGWERASAADREADCGRRRV